MKTLKVNIGIALCIPNLGTRWGWLVDATSHQLTSRPFLGPTCGPIRWAQRFIFQVVKLNSHIHLLSS